MDLKQYLPSFYLESAEVVNIQDAMAVEDTNIKLGIEDLKNQFFVSTCTWAIDLWERYVGISVDKAQTIENRRKAVISMLSGQGTATKQLIISICQEFSNSKVEIIENNNDYSFIIKFTTYKGVPSNLKALSNTIDKIKPAYLGYDYEFLFNNHKFFQRYSHQYLGKMTHDKLRVF